MAHIINIRQLLGNDVRSRIYADKIRNALSVISDKNINLDFAEVSFISRSFADEVLSIISETSDKNISIINTIDFVRNMFSVVEKSRRFQRNTTDMKCKIRKFNGMEDLSAFLLQQV